MFGLRSAQGRARVAILVLLVLLVGVATLASWRAQGDRKRYDEIQQRAAVVASLECARGQFFRGTVLVLSALFMEDSRPLIDSYHEAQVAGDEGLEQARTGLTALGASDGINVLDSFAEQISQLRQAVDGVLAFDTTADTSARVALALQYYPQMWPKIESMLEDLDQLSHEQQATLVAESAVADRASDTTLIQLIGFGAFAILGGVAMLMMLIISVIRPLAALQESARAVASGNLEARAEVSGPTEVASLARDFNEMVAQRRWTEQALRESERGLKERAKELNCLYGISNLVQGPDISLEELLQGTVNLIPPSWQYPEIACARIVLGGQEYLTDNFRETAWRQTSDIIVNGERTGAVEVCYLEEKPESDEGPFLTEERDLINAIAERLGRVSERRQAEEALYKMSRRDPLTGVLNHGAIVNGIGSLISTDEQGSRCALAMIDVDRLKVTNDTYSHQVGDAVLVAVAAALSRDDALVGRYGGDEFVAILPGADRNAAERYRKDATEALALVSITDPQTGATVRAEASIGLAVYPEDGSTFADLLKFSDSAMYAVKQQRHDRRRSPRKHAPDRKAA
jgi:diguanylate cyclase (GGDEF)-like protein